MRVDGSGAPLVAMLRFLLEDETPTPEYMKIRTYKQTYRDNKDRYLHRPKSLTSWIHISEMCVQKKQTCTRRTNRLTYI